MRSFPGTSLLLGSLLAALLGLATPASADVVDACPPGFRPSHSGCHFAPAEEDLFLCGGSACVMIGLGTVSALLLLRRTREGGSREGGHG